MAEEVRFFVRIALFTIVIGTIYWLVSYEEAGTILFGGIVASAGTFALAIALRVRAAREGGRGLKALFGFEDVGSDRPLNLDEDTFPSASLWPAAASLGSVLLALGLIYGAWLWVPGLAIALSATWGWLTELD